MLRPTSLYTTPAAASLFGKLPALLDFVRVGHDSPEAVQLDRFLHAGLARLAARGQAWPRDALRFVFVAPAARHALTGVIAPSRDRAGRGFPLSIYARIPLASPHLSAAVLTLSCEAFAAAAEALLQRAGQLRFEELAIELRGLQLPSAQEHAEHAQRLATRLSRDTAQQFAAGVSREERSLTAASIQAACQRLLTPRTPSGMAFDAFECPVKNALDVATWTRLLELAHARPSSCWWNVADEQPRALLAIGPLPERAALYWALPGHKHPQLSALHIAAAVQAPAADSDAADSGETLAAMFARLQRRLPPQPRK